MNVEIIMQDSKGITEYTKEERENPQLEKQIKISENSLEMVVKKLCRQYPLLHPAIRYFEYTAVKENILLETDGKHVFYQPQKIQDLYVKKQLQLLESKYLHFVIHGLLGHFYAHSQLGKDVLWDAILDYEVNMITNSLAYRKVEGADKKRLGIRGLYWYAKKHVKIAAQLKAHKDADRHEIWDRDMKRKIGSIQLENSGNGETEVRGNERYGLIGDITAEVKRELEEKWKEIQELVGIGKELDEQKFKNILKGKLAGMERGNWEEAYEAAEENGNSYREHIIQFIREREIMKEQEGTIDKMLYSFGFELYGDVAFIEPEEYSENKALKKVVIALDTSGSCLGETMNEFLRETKNLLQDISEISSFQEVILMQCDTEIQKEEHFQNTWEFPEEKSWKMRGFGGTDFCPVFKKVGELIEEESDEIDFLVYFSDGYGEFPEEKPEYPVFFVLPEPDERGRLPEWVIPVWYKNI